jgi:hypothetical protein
MKEAKRLLMLFILLIGLCISAFIVSAISLIAWHFVLGEETPLTIPSVLLNGILPFSIVIWVFVKIAKIKQDGDSN